MVKVITYGTFDLLHYGHIKLLERAKSLGDYLIVGVTSDDYDKTRGKINNQQSLMERIAAIKETGIADEIIVEEYEGQKIEDIRRNNIDIFAIGSDWKGKFDYLADYCKIVYLERTAGISSSDIRKEKRKLRVGIKGDARIRKKFIDESKYVNGIEIVGICGSIDGFNWEPGYYHTSHYNELISKSDAIYVVSKPECHYEDVKTALIQGKHVICESPIALKTEECSELFNIAKRKRLILFDGIKTAYSTAFQRLVLLAKGNNIGTILSVDAVCTSLKDELSKVGTNYSKMWNSMCSWAPIALLPIFQILGTEYRKKIITTKILNKEYNIDAFTKVDLVFANAVASIKVAKGAKAEGQLVITGTNGYIYVPAPWWKTDYFEIRYEKQENNRRFFYQLDGEGIRYEIVSFAKAVESVNDLGYVDEKISKAITAMIEDFNNRTDVVEID